jgi:hypothetical protein
VSDPEDITAELSEAEKSELRRALGNPQCPYKAKLRVGSTGSYIDVDCVLHAGHTGRCLSALDTREVQQ